MADLDKVLKGLECCDKKYPRNAWCKYCPYEPDCCHDSTCDLLIHDALKLLESQQAEIERLERENVDLKLAIQSMPNWLNEKRPEVVRCKDCRYSLPSSENVILCTAPCESQYPKAYKPIDWFCAGGERKDGDGMVNLDTPLKDRI